jgi:heat shock protein HtpX
MEKRVDFRDQISKNKWKSFFLMLGIVVIIVLLGYVISLAYGADFFIIMAFVSIFSIVYVSITYYKSDKIALASVGAKSASETHYKDFHRLVEGISIASGLPKPKLYVMPSQQINAFASGRNPQNAVICVTEGALNKLDRRELEGVIAHEMGHIGNYDIRYMTFVAVGVGMISIISQLFLRSLWFRGGRNDKGKGIFILIGIVLAILSPIVVYFIQMAISRKREYASDATAVQYTRNPNGLINALKKIQSDLVEPEKRISKAVAPLFFANPLKGLSSTHPPIEDRIKKLQRM